MDDLCSRPRRARPDTVLTHTRTQARKPLDENSLPVDPRTFSNFQLPLRKPYVWSPPQPKTRNPQPETRNPKP